MAMTQTAFRTRPIFHYVSATAANCPCGAEMPLFQAFSRPFRTESTDGHCIKDTTTIDPACGSGSLLLNAEKIKTTGTDTDCLMPPVSRFGAGGARTKKKQSVIDKLKAFFERFSGIGGGSFTEKRNCAEVGNHAEIGDSAETRDGAKTGGARGDRELREGRGQRKDRNHAETGDSVKIGNHVETGESAETGNYVEAGTAQRPGTVQRPGITQKPGMAQRPGITQKPGTAQKPGITQIHGSVQELETTQMSSDMHIV